MSPSGRSIHLTSTPAWTYKRYIHSSKPILQTTSARLYSRVCWGVSIQRWGRPFDHGLVECKFKVRIKTPCRIHQPDFTALKNIDVAKKFDDVVSHCLNTKLLDPECADERLSRLNHATQQAVKSLPAKKRQALRRQYVSAHTKELYENRAKEYNQLTPDELCLRKREINRLCRNDYRTYISDVVKDIAAAERVGNMREVSRLTKSICSTSKPSYIMPSKATDGTPFTSAEHLLDAWQTFLGKKFECADRPGAVFAPDIAEKWPNEDVVTWEDFDVCVQAL